MPTDSFADARSANAFHTFVCHATEDHAVAQTICASLEASGVRCWIAPRDVPAGANYADSIVSAITQANAVLLIFSSHAEASPHVRRELEQAVNNDVRIVPIRIENVMPSPEVKYYLGSWQWLDAFPPPIEKHLDRVVGAVKIRVSPTAVARRRRRRLVGIIAGAVVLAVAVVAILLQLAGGGGGDDEEAQRVQACRDTHALSKASTKRVESDDRESYRAVFEACAWPPVPGADGDGFSQITVASNPGPGQSEAEGLTVRDVFTSECRDLEVRYLFDNQGTFVADKPLRLRKGEIVRVEGGSVWQPRTAEEAEIYGPRRDEIVVLSNLRYNVDSARCV
jgi:TIR domain